MNMTQIQNRLFNFYSFVYLADMWINSKKSAKKQLNIQNRRLRKLIKEAYKIPFYRERFDRSGVRPQEIRTKEDLALLPVLTKEEYRTWMNEELRKSETKYYKLTHTSGSTGIPTTNIYPPKEYACHYMMDLFCWVKGGYNPFLGKTLTCSPGDEKVGKTIFQKIGILRRECFSPYWELSDIVKKINEYKPDFILANSSWLIYIANYVETNGLHIHKPMFYCAGGENVSGCEQKLLEDVFGKGMINYYGCTEMADFAYRKPKVSYYDLNNTYMCVMVKDRDKITSSGEGSVLATPLYRLRYPLINYDMGDQVSVEEIEGLSRIMAIEGRKNQSFIWANGKETVFKELWDITATIEDIFQIRFVQETNCNLTMIVVKDSSSKKTNDELEQYLKNKYFKAFGNGVSIAFDWVENMPPDENGKIRNMVSRI